LEDNMTFDPDEFLAEESTSQMMSTNFNPDEFLAQPEINSIGTEKKPINKSPLSFGQRLAIGFGKPDTNINYLKSQYEDAKIGANGKEMVMQDGLWYAVDEKGFTAGDLAEIVGEAPVIAGGIIGELVGGTVGAGAGAAGGAGVGAVPGAAAGVVAGGALGSGAGNVVKQTLGKALGVRQEFNPSEVLAESAIGGVGAALGVGLAKYGAKGGKEIVKGANRKAGGYIGDQATDLLGAMNGTGGKNTRLMFQRPDEVLNFRNAKPERVIEAADETYKIIDNHLKEVSKLKQSIYKKAADSGIKVNTGEALATAVQDVDGVTKPLIQVFRDAGIMDDSGKFLTDSPVFKGKGMSQVKSLISDFKGNTKMTFRELDSTIKRIDDLVDYDPVLKVKKTGTQAEALLKKIRHSLAQKRNEVFGVADDFEDMATRLQMLKDPVNPTKEVFKDKKAIERLLKSIDTDSGLTNTQFLEDLAQSIPGLNDVIDKVRVHNAAKAYTRFLPPTKGGFGSAEGAANIGRLLAIPAIGTPAAPLFSPIVGGGLVRTSKRTARELGRRGVTQTAARGSLSALGLR
jgi:hypothetical protein